MPMVNTTPNTVARLAMGTAILTVISGCDTRVGQGISDVTGPLAEMPAALQETFSPSTTVVVQPSYVAPGAPTYTERSRAADVQTFESIYGQPVTADPADTVAAAETYALPSYDDGTVTAQPLAAPTVSYAQRVEAEIAPVYAPLPVETSSIVYSDAPAPDLYTVMPEPVALASIATVPIEDGAVYGVLAPDPVSFDAVVEPVEGVSSTGFYTIESVPAYAPADAVIEPMPTMQNDAVPPPLSFDDSLPMTDASAAFDAVPTQAPLAFEAPLDTLPSPVEPILSARSFVSTSRDTVHAPGGMQIIGDDEAAATYGVAPSAGSPDTTLSISVAPLPTLSYGAPIETAALTTAPFPAPKATRAMRAPATVSPAMAYSPRTAPLPRRRPGRVENNYAMMTAPLPQPRPDYEAPMAAATSSGRYISVGALPAIGAADAPVPVRKAQIGAIDRAMPVAVQPEPMTVTDVSELSGTSWRLTMLRDEPVSTNAELHFDGTSDFAGGQGPCNSYGGEFRNAGKGRFSMANIFSTDASCSNIEVEKRYLDALRESDGYRIAPGFSAMTLLDRNGREVMRFKAF